MRIFADLCLQAGGAVLECLAGALTLQAYSTYWICNEYELQTYLYLAHMIMIDITLRRRMISDSRRGGRAITSPGLIEDTQNITGKLNVYMRWKAVASHYGCA